MDATITFTVNGKKRTVTVDRQRTLLDVLREELQLTGTHFGCGEGQCGACTVLMESKPTRSCITLATEADGKSVVTIEGLAVGEKLHPVQEAFLAEEAFQCGYCTPGMIMTTVALLGEKPNPTDAEVVAALNGNLCRCNGYAKILKAVRRASGKAGR